MEGLGEVGSPRYVTLARPGLFLFLQLPPLSPFSTFEAVMAFVGFETPSLLDAFLRGMRFFTPD